MSLLKKVHSKNNQFIMKITNIQNKKSFGKKIMYSVLFLGSFIFTSYKSIACTASFTYSAGLNGHYSFTGSYSGYGPGLRYSWNAGDGSGWQNGGANFNHVYLTNNTFTVKLAANDSLCFDTATVVITVTNVTSPCTLSAGFNYTNGSNGEVTFTSTSTGTNSNTLYFWSPGDSNQRYQESSVYTHQYPFRGYYTAWLTIEDTGSAYCIDSIPELVYVTSADSVYCHIHANFSYAVGSNGNVTFTNTSTGTSPTDYYYLTPGDTTPMLYSYSTGDFTHQYLFDGTYNVYYYIQGDSNSCSDSITLPVTVTGACNLEANFTYAFDSNGGVKFTSTSVGTNGSTVYKWTFGDGSPTVDGDDTITYGYPFIATYTVTLVDSNSSGCVASVTKTIYIYNRDSLQASFTYTADTLNPLQIDFTSTSLGTNSNTYFKWTPGDGNLPDSGIGMNTYQHIYTSFGPYAATLTIWYTVLPKIRTHSTSNRFDESSYTLVVNVEPTAVPIVSEASATYKVYPNPSTGMFRLAVTGLTNDKDAQIRISNLMGQVVYQTNTSVANGQITSDINLPNAADGIYLLQVISQGNTYTTRIAVQK